MIVRALVASAAVTLALATSGCEPTPAPPEDVRTLLALPDHFETPFVPEDNPLTADKIALGRHLFYDRRLSANGTQACADCHEQARAFSDGRRTPTGSTGQVLVRNSQGLSNVAYAASLTWASASLVHLEDQIAIPLRNDNPIELGVTDSEVDGVLARFADDPTYTTLFARAFPESTSGPTMGKILLALASFCRSLISSDSAYDRFLAGDREAMSEEARRGLSLFNGERFECFHCHGGTQLTTNYRDASDTELRLTFFNNGLYNVGGDGSYPPYDQGLYELTFDARHRGLFRPPSLRNVEHTAPYMHDGSIETLREVVLHYARGGRLIESGPLAGDGRLSPLRSGLVRGFTATDDEVDSVVAFLEALSDPSFLTNPAYASPFPPP
jgi:cytochrome c peroxidase